MLAAKKAVTLSRQFHKKCQELRQLKKNLEDVALGRMKEKLEPVFFTILKCQLRNAGTRTMKKLCSSQCIKRAQEHTELCHSSSQCEKPYERPKKLDLLPGINPIMIEALKQRVLAMTWFFGSWT